MGKNRIGSSQRINTNAELKLELVHDVLERGITLPNIRSFVHYSTDSRFSCARHSLSIMGKERQRAQFNLIIKGQNKTSYYGTNM